MAKIFERLDRLAKIGDNGRAAMFAERTAFVFLVLAFAAAPHSISATQIAGGIALGASILRLAIGPRTLPAFGRLDAALWGLFAWTFLSSLFSHEPVISLKQTLGTAVFLCFYLVRLNVRSRSAASFLALILISSCMVAVVWTPIERSIGRGVAVQGLAADGPLAKALLWDGDTLLAVDGRKVGTPEEVVAAIEAVESASVKFYRPDFELSVDVKRANLLPGEAALQRLGAASWKKGRNWRSMGFLGHYTTFAELLQLIGSLAFGLLVAGFAARAAENGTAGPAKEEAASGRTPGETSALRNRHLILLLAVAVAGISAVLLLTWTRAPQVGFVISAGTILSFGLRRKWLLIAGVALVAAALAGMFLLKQARGVDFLDRADESTRYRQVMLNDGLRLWTENPTHFIFGVGMDSVRTHWREWGMFEGGYLQFGHFHSTPLQLLVERGLPALLLWLAIAGFYLRSLLRGLKEAEDPFDKGILLGCLGGALGFLFSGIVHYNLGDQEVAMLFFMLMGLAIAIIERPAGAGPGALPGSAAVRLAA
ncbi:MAG: O-antigen ligase family protein [Pyrinomonadaceae bacterium]